MASTQQSASVPTGNIYSAISEGGRSSTARFSRRLGWCPFWVAAIIIALAVPTEFSFNLGSLRLSAYRVILIVAFIPSILKLMSGRAGKVHLADILILTHILWSFIVIAIHHGGATSLESGGIRMLELAGGYLIARTSIIGEKEFRGSLAFLFLVVAMMTPFVVFEAVTGKHLLKSVSAAIVGKGFYSPIEPRMGFHRAYGPFDHPILLGVFAASLTSVIYFESISRTTIRAKTYLTCGIIMLAAVSSVSSGALACLVVQISLIMWNKVTAKMRRRWLLLTGLMFLAYLYVDLLSTRTPLKVFMTYLTFSSGTAYARLNIFDFAIQDVWRNPIFGIGFNDWTRPAWMHSSSMDNFWLVTAVTFGFPGLVTLATATVLVMSRRWKRLKPDIRKLRLGWTISMIGFAIAATTVHLWNSLFVYFGVFLGLGSWFSTNLGNYESTAPRAAKDRTNLSQKTTGRSDFSRPIETGTS